MSIKSELTKTRSYLRNARKAIVGRGGEISLTAGLKDLSSAIYNIPADASLVYQTDDSIAYERTIPAGAKPYALLSRIGGMTYKNHSNLISFPYTDGGVGAIKYGNGVIYEVLADGGIHVWGKTGAYGSTFSLMDREHLVPKLKAGNYYTITAGLTFEEIDIKVKTIRINADGTQTDLHWNGKGIPFYFGDNYTTSGLFVKIRENTEVDVVIYPMLTISEGDSMRDTKVTSLECESINSSIPFSTYTIPEAITSLAGYGEGVNEEYYNYIDFENKKFVQMCETIVLDGVNNGVDEVELRGSYCSGEVPLPQRFDGVKNIIASHFRTATSGLGTCCMTRPNLTRNELHLINRNQTLTTVEAWNAWLKQQYDYGTPVTITYALYEPIETDISEYLEDITFIEVEGEAILTAENELKNDVPLTINYIVEVGA